MNLEQMQSMWQDHSAKLDACLSINERLLAEKQIEKQKGELNKLIVNRTVEGLLFFILVLSLSNYIVSSWGLTAPVLSAFVLNIFAIIGLAGNIGQIVLLSKIDFSEPINATLTKLIEVRTHNLNIFKLVMISTPFYMAYVFLGFDIILGVDLFSLMSVETKIALLTIAMIFGGLVVILLRKLKPENRENKFIGWLLKEVSGERLTQLLDKIENKDQVNV